MTLNNVPFASNFMIYENNGTGLTPYQGTFSYSSGVLTTTAPEALSISIFIPDIVPSSYTGIPWTISKHVTWIREDGTLLPAVLAYTSSGSAESPTLFVIVDSGTLVLAGYNYNSNPIANGVVFGHYTSTDETTFEIESFYNDSTSLSDVVVENPAFVVNNTYYYWRNMSSQLTGNVTRVGNVIASSGNISLRNIPTPAKYSLFIDSNNNLMVAKQISDTVYQGTSYEDGQLLYQSGSNTNIFSLSSNFNFWALFVFIIFIIIIIIFMFLIVRSSSPVIIESKI